jgi:hypothetical protein
MLRYCRVRTCRWLRLVIRKIRGMPRLPTIGFDTRGINQLEDGGEHAEQLMKALRGSFEVLLPAMTVDELLSTPETKNPRREKLLTRCERLLASGQCLWPPHWILQLLIQEHSKNPMLFDWTKIDMRARVYERAIVERDFTNQLCVQQRKEQFEVEKRFEKMWKDLRPKLDEILLQDPSKRPTSYHEAVAIASMEDGVLWGIGRGLYDHITHGAVTEAEIRAFAGVCPPFRAACYALVVSWYEIALKLRSPEENSPAGRNDLMMAVYLPYCTKFIADESAQVTSLSEIAAESSINCDVQTLQQFDAALGSTA